MKKLILLLSLLLPLVVFSQKPEPFKGAKKIIATYPLAGDSLYKVMVKNLVLAGYTLDKREPDLLYVTTEDKPIKQIGYSMRLEVRDSSVIVSARYKAAMGLQIGWAKTEPQYEVLKYTSKAYVTRNAFDDMIDFVTRTSPKKVEYE